MKAILKLENKVAIVTGGASGLGKAAAIALAKEGADIVVADIDISSAEIVVEEIKKLKRKAFCIRVDITNSKEVEEMVKKAVRTFERIDILVNSAGIARGPNQWGKDGWLPMEEVSEDDWDKVIDVNLKGTFLCDQKVGKEMIKRKKGKIINIASISGIVANKGLLGHGPYCASKAGVIALTKVLAIEWAKYNINVNCISPGYMLTKMGAKSRDIPEIHKIQIDMTPMRRFGKPWELGQAVVFLSSEDSNYITGHNLVMDGGYTAW